MAMTEPASSCSLSSLGANEMHNAGSSRWIKDFFMSDFFVPCSCSKQNCNVYCILCSLALCQNCYARGHGDHGFLQVRRSSYNSVVRLVDAVKYLDIAGIQEYIINNAQVAFLRARPSKPSARGSSSSCVVCSRTIVPGHRFCSIECKYKWIETTGDAASSLTPTGSSSHRAKAADFFKHRPDKTKVSTSKPTNVSSSEPTATDKSMSEVKETAMLKTADKRAETPTGLPDLGMQVALRRPGCCNRRKGVPHKAPLSGIYSIF